MARLTTAQRNALPASDFAGPNRSFPINDAAHAKAAGMLSGHASEATKKKIKSKSKKFFGKGKEERTAKMADAIRG
jgi:hypothetical protein